MSEVRVNISGDRWVVKVVSERQMKKIRGEGHAAAGGLCVPSEKTIYLDKDCVNYETIAHEIYHANFTYLHLDDTNTVPLADVEEILAGQFAAKGDKMVRQAKSIVRRLLKEMK